MNNRVLLITKDALCKDYLPVYGNKYWKGKTPNIDELAQKGTVFERHCTAAPSTVMSFRAMVTGKFAFEQPYSNYTPKEVPGNDSDMFEIAKNLGYSCHILWDSAWDEMVLRYGNCYGKETIIHSVPELRQGVGCHYRHIKPLETDDFKCNNTLNKIIHEVKDILSKDEKVFLWIHLPHVINGRTAYGSDIDVFDKLIGMLRHYFNDNDIFISADHGNMNGHNSKYCYGFDVNTSSVEIPLITPRIEDYSLYEEYTSNIDIKELIFDRSIKKRNYIFSDCAYYAQPHRKLAIYRKPFVYIYNKIDNTEELYDIENDRYELHNLLKEVLYDTDRKINSPVREYYFSPYWDDTRKILDSFRAIKEEIWKNAPWQVELKEKYMRLLKNFAVKIFKFFNLKI